MDKLIVQGGSSLHGTVTISGSKNAALPVLVASLLTDDEVVIEHVPTTLRDIRTMIQVLSHLGKHIHVENDCVVIQHNGASHADVPYDLVRQMRASALVIGPLLARYGTAKVALPGGCAIGARPINIHLDGFKALGATIELREGYECLRASQLVGTRIVLDYPSVGATENLLMAASLAYGVTTIENAAREPEISDLIQCLHAMGAKISGIDTSTLVVQGVEKLHGAQHSVIPDRIEAGTFMLAAAITRGDVLLRNANPTHLTSLISRMEEAGIHVSYSEHEIRIHVPDGIKPVDIETSPYPGFPTDMQAQWMALLCTAHGSSVVTETVFENRFMHVLELCRMGAHIKIKGNSVFVEGTDTLSGASVMATDLRASAALVLAALVAKGKTEILRIYHLDRGYERIEEKLKQLGARIERKKE